MRERVLTLKRNACVILTKVRIQKRQAPTLDTWILTFVRMTMGRTRQDDDGQARYSAGGQSTGSTRSMKIRSTGASASKGPAGPVSTAPMASATSMPSTTRPNTA